VVFFFSVHIVQMYLMANAKKVALGIKMSLGQSLPVAMNVEVFTVFGTVIINPHQTIVWEVMAVHSQNTIDLTVAQCLEIEMSPMIIQSPIRFLRQISGV
jgi:hypothetical protein